MKTIDKAEEKRLIGAIERAISHTNQGMEPNDAITKIAREEKFSPPFIHRMVESFNKSKSVFRLKEAAEQDRHKPFALANADTVLKNVFLDVKPLSKEASEIPFSPVFSFGFDEMMQRSPSLEKTASTTPAPQTPEEKLAAASQIANKQYQQAHMVQALRDRLHTEVLVQKRAFEKAVESACDQLLPMSDKGLRKVAQALVNGYPGTGDKLVRVLAAKTRRPIPALHKTANAAVFPAEEPYLTIAKVYEYAEKHADAQNELNRFEKQALDFGGSFAANALANVLATGDESLGESLRGVGSKKTVDKDELLDPVHFNRLRELDAKRTLMGLMLHDPDLKDYKYSDIVKAYNSAVSSVPEAQANPVVLKTLLMKNLETSGIKDVFELAQEQQVAKGMSEAELYRDKVRQTQEQRIQDEPEPEKRTAITGRTHATSLQDRAKDLRELASKQVKALQSDGKEEAAADPLSEYREQALFHLRGGKKKGPINTKMLSSFKDTASSPRRPDGTQNPDYQRPELAGTTVDDLARDIQKMMTMSKADLVRDPAYIRLKHQYGLMT